MNTFVHISCWYFFLLWVLTQAPKIKRKKMSMWQLHTTDMKLWIRGWTVLAGQTGIWLFLAHWNVWIKIINNTHFTGDLKLLKIVQFFFFFFTLCCISAAVGFADSHFAASSPLSKKLPRAADRLSTTSSSSRLSSILKQLCCSAGADEQRERKHCI